MNKRNNKKTIEVDALFDVTGNPVSDNPPLLERFPIVGIGASAGGLAAFEAFFTGFQEEINPEMAFVLIQHLAPDHKSILADLIRHYTKMQVFEVEDGMKVKANCVYIIPPNFDMAFLNGALQLIDPVSPHGHRLPIDYFFRSLAQDQHERAICVILSGTGSDGTLGMRSIKGEGGLVIVQQPETTEYDGMPHSAISTGLVDFVVPVGEMAEVLINYCSNTKRNLLLLKNEKTNQPNENILQKVFILLRSKTGHDFSHYKVNTINRRVERRMAICHIDSLENYIRFMQQTPNEVDLLFRDLLIGVTNFFRDNDAFKILEERVIPKMFEEKNGNDVIRVWVPGCSTGEEAYSIAILMAEHMEFLKKNIKIQIFATDLDEQAITVARSGLYPASVVLDIIPERLARYFSIEPDGSAYKINKQIRDMLVFSEQDVIKDPPFSKLDLISCRNVMIYMGGVLQKKLIPLFYYSLNQDGILFLGTSETIGEFVYLFDSIDKKYRVYQKHRDGKQQKNNILEQNIPIVYTSEKKLAMEGKYSKKNIEPNFKINIPPREITEQTLLEQIAPVGILVKGNGDILYLHGQTGDFLELNTGEIGVLNVLKIAKEGLRRQISVALHKTVNSKEAVTITRVKIKNKNNITLTDLTVRPVISLPQLNSDISIDEPLFLIIFERSETKKATEYDKLTKENETNIGESADIGALKKELLLKEEYLQSANEELETSTEELRSANEEMQSVNEELQSTNEELETSKEELQSVNEELSTVNVELQTKVNDLSRINNDMSNLLSGTGIGIVFVDFNLCIVRFTPVVTKIINLINSDIGRPVSHIMSNLVGYSNLVNDTQEVLNTLIPKKMDVQTILGTWYSLIIQPYRTQENVIEGAVITFVDISDAIKTSELLQNSNDQLRLSMVARDSKDAITAQDMEGRVIAWNKSAKRLYGWSESEALLKSFQDLIPENGNVEYQRQLMNLIQKNSLESYQSHRIAKDGRIVDIWLTATALIDDYGNVYGISTIERLRDN